MSWTSARARLAAIIRDHPDDHEAIAAARRDLRAARLEDHVRRVVDDDLPLTPRPTPPTGWAIEGWCAMNPAVVAWVEATRRRQGLPPRVEDARALDEVAAIAVMRVEGVTADARAS